MFMYYRSKPDKKRGTNMSDTFCPLPWLGYAIRNNGDLRVCCHANQGPNRGILFKDDDTSFRYNDSIDESRNSKTLKDIRLTMLQNKWHPECIRCEREYNSNLRPRNINETLLWDDEFTEEDARHITQSDGSIDTSDIDLMYYDLRFGNVCNLRCRMCYPTDSSGWFKEYESVFGRDTYEDTTGPIRIINQNGKFIAEGNPYDWYKEQSFWDELNKYKDQVKHMYIVGGEPLMAHEHYDFLDACVENGTAKDIQIEYNTNLTILPDRAINVWKHFKRVRFGVSIDGVGKINDYIRWPSKFSNIEKNLRILDDSPVDYKMWIACTISVYNILHLPDLFIWKLKQNFKKVNPHPYRSLVTTHPVHRPDYINIKVFPEVSKRIVQTMLKQRMIDIYKAIDESNIPHKKRTRAEAAEVINGYIQYMYQDDYSEHIPYFWRYNDKMDEVRGCKLDDYIPELRGLLK